MMRIRARKDVYDSDTSVSERSLCVVSMLAAWSVEMLSVLRGVIREYSVYSMYTHVSMRVTQTKQR
jgi:hypothetical protein